MNHKANQYIPSYPHTQTGWSSLDGVAHLPFGHAYPWPFGVRLAIGESTTHPPTPPNSPSYPHTISGAPKLVKRNFSATPTNQIKETKYKALRMGNYLHVLLLTQILSAALLLGPANVSRGIVLSNSLHPSLVPYVLK